MQEPAPPERHRHPERRLLAGCHNRQCCSGGAANTRGNIQPFRVDGDSCHSHASQAERGARERKARILHPSSHLFKLKPTDRETERAGESGRHEHLRGAAPNAARYAQVSRDLLPQVRITTRIRIADPPRRSSSRLTSQDA